MQTDALIQELIKLDQLQQKTGRKNHKRHNEILLQMCQEYQAAISRSMESTKQALTAFNIMKESFGKMERRAKSLETANYELFWIMQGNRSELKEYQA